MKVFNNWLETLKQIVRDNPKKIAISLIISSVVIGILFFLVSYSRTAIRQNQIEALVYPQILSDKLVPLPYDQESEKIKKNRCYFGIICQTFQSRFPGNIAHFRKTRQ